MKYDEKKKKIYVDADACPVKNEIVTLANTYHLSVVFVASYSHYHISMLEGKWVYVDPVKEAVDLYILNNAAKNDVIITQDTGLASILVKRQCIVISPRGKQFVEAEMDTILNFRYLAAKERRNGIYSKGPKAFSEDDRKNFISVLEKNCRNLQDLNAEL